MREEEQRAKRRAWGISVLIHAVLFLLVAQTGLFLLVRPDREQVVEDTVWIDQPAGPAGGGGGAKGNAPSAADSMQLAMPPAADLPTIAEDYTRHPEKKKEYRKQHHVTEEGVKSEPKEVGDVSSTGNSPQGSTGGGNSSGTGTGNGNGTGDGAGNGVGHGAASRGGGEGSTASEPAKCLSKASPEYPPSLRSQNAEGVVALLIYVQDGSVTNVTVTGSSGYGAMDQAAVSAGYRCRFRGSGVYPIRYRFKMTDGDDW